MPRNNYIIGTYKIGNIDTCTQLRNVATLLIDANVFIFAKM
jgi:hypothetical protein